MAEKSCKTCLYCSAYSYGKPCNQCLKDGVRTKWTPKTESRAEVDLDTYLAGDNATMDLKAGIAVFKTDEGAVITDKDGSTVLGDQVAKADAGKLQIHLVPTQIIRDIAEIRMYGNEKYHDPDNWKQVEAVRYRDALARHFLAYLDNPDSVDEESGKKHLKHMACNVAFLCALENREEK